MAGARRKESSNDEMSSLEDQMKKLNTGEKRDINILLLGETGVGKSTFINAFCNYLQIPNLRCAMNGKLTTLIPAKFTIMDENFIEQVVQVGADANEFVEIGVSATQAARSYVFPIRRGKLRVRFIDTPGIGDTRGIDQDNANFENVLSFIGELNHLNAICILLKPNNARLTVQFEFCIKQLLSRLEKSASQNLVFVFTNCRSTLYRPGETYPALKKLLQGIQSVEIPLRKDNIFCMDNEAFRFLAAANNGIKFDPMDVENFAQSWKQSFRECWRMISYIAGDASSTPLSPHLVKNTISVNEARRLIVQLSQPLAEIAQLIQDNITVLQRHKARLELSDNTLSDLRSKLYIPVMNLRVIKMDQPTTVCTSSKCRTVYQVGELQKFHYHQQCHKPCYLTNVPKEIVGSPELASCSAMGGSMTCSKCKCSYQVHMHIYYETESYVDKLENEAVRSEIHDKNLALMQAQNVVIKIERRLKEYEEERDIILKTTAKFAHFLQENAITPYNDAYQAYLSYLIDREKSLGNNTNYETIKEFRRMLQCYNEEKRALQHALLQSPTGVNTITADEIINCVESLYNLKHNGVKIQELFVTQKSARKDENKSETREYVHASAQKKQRKKKRNRNKKQQVNDTTDSEYASDANHYNQRYNNRHFVPPLMEVPTQQYKRGSPNHHYNQRRPPNQQYNQRGLSNQQYNQRAPADQQYNQRQFQQHNQRQPYHNQPNNAYQQQTSSTNNQQKPVQYLQIKQDPSGKFDLRFGQTNQNSNNFRSQSPQIPFAPQGGQQYNQNNDQHGAYPNPLNLNQHYNKSMPQLNQRSFGRTPPRSHSPNSLGNHPSNFQTYQGAQACNPAEGLNQGEKPFNQGWHGQNVNQRRSRSQGPKDHGPNLGGRPFTNQPFNRGPNQNFNHDRRSNNNQRQQPQMQSDSGCESAGGYRKYKNNNRICVTYRNSNRRHFLDNVSSSSSSSSSDEESYITCK